MDHLVDLPHIRIVEPQGIGKCQHQPCRLSVKALFKRLHVDIAQLVCFDLPRLESSKGGAGRIGPVGRVGDEDRVPPGSSLLMVGRDQHEAGEFAVCTGQGLQGEIAETEDLAVEALRFMEDRQGTLHQCGAAFELRQKGVEFGKPRKRRQVFMKSRVVLHGARTERIKGRLDGHVPPAQVDEMADDIQLTELGQCRLLGSLQRDRHGLGRRHIRLGKRAAPPTR